MDSKVGGNPSSSLEERAYRCAVCVVVAWHSLHQQQQQRKDDRNSAFFSVDLEVYRVSVHHVPLG